MSEDRERAEAAADKISDRILKTSPGDRWNMIADVIETVLTKRNEELVAAAVRKAYKIGWEGAMFDAHVNYGADEDAPAPELNDVEIAALVEVEK